MHIKVNVPTAEVGGASEVFAPSGTIQRLDEGPERTILTYEVTNRSAFLAGARDLGLQCEDQSQDNDRGEDYRSEYGG